MSAVPRMGFGTCLNADRSAGVGHPTAGADQTNRGDTDCGSYCPCDGDEHGFALHLDTGHHAVSRKSCSDPPFGNRQTGCPRCEGQEGRDSSNCYSARHSHGSGHAFSHSLRHRDPHELLGGIRNIASRQHDRGGLRDRQPDRRHGPDRTRRICQSIDSTQLGPDSISDPSHDVVAVVPPGISQHVRYFTLSPGLRAGAYDIAWGLRNPSTGSRVALVAAPRSCTSSASFRHRDLGLPAPLSCCRMEEVRFMKEAAHMNERNRASIYTGGLTVPTGISAPFAMRPVIMQT